MTDTDARDLPRTEARSETTRGLDTLATADLVAVLAREQALATEAVLRAAPDVARVVDAIVARVRDGGTLHYVGAGTSGRLAMLDAAECPPTFGTSPSLVVAHVAGGDAALVRAIEGAEDDAGAGVSAMREIVRADAVVGISASGGAPFVCAALRAARAAGALAIGIANDPAARLFETCDLRIVLDTGAEPIAGSTRLKAGTAQKMVLNAISTATMVRLGHVYDNVMVDVVATNAKLRARARDLVMRLGAVDEPRALAALAAAGGSAKVAIAMIRRACSASDARAHLAHHDGRLRDVLEAHD